MITKILNDYTINNYRQINDSLENLRSWMFHAFQSFKYEDKVGKISELQKTIDRIENVSNIFTLEQILKFSKKNYIREFNEILLYVGYNDKDYPDEILFAITNLMPRIQDYLICKPADYDPKLAIFLAKNKLYNIIKLFRYEKIAKECRQLMSKKCSKSHKSAILSLTQMYGLIPASEFKQEKPPAKSTILYMGNGKNMYIIDSYKFFNTKSVTLTTDFLKSEIFPLEIKTIKRKHEFANPKRVYETFDGIHFRQLKTEFYDRLFRGPSPMAHGYNTEYNRVFCKRFKEPLLTQSDMEQIVISDKIFFRDLKSKYRKIPRNKWVPTLINDLYLKYKNETGLMARELKLGLINEENKMQKKLNASKDLDYFFNKIVMDKDNFILRFERKLKIFRSTKKCIGWENTSQSKITFN